MGLGVRRLLPALLSMAANTAVGGQAVMEGVMIRDRNRLAIAVRRPDGDIEVEVRPWFSMVRWDWLKKPYLRGFPILVETLVNGVSALNWSAQRQLDEEEDGEIGPWAMAGTLIVSLAMALGLFVVLPHALAAGLTWFGLSGDADTLSFHAWDGVFKLAVFVLYIWSISLIPDIRRVFQYHGAEHKTIWAYEKGEELIPENVRMYSRLHPRCGTTFLLFVLALSILVFTVLVPLVLAVWQPEGTFMRHGWIILLKFMCMIPISCLAYELLKGIAGVKGAAGRFMSFPGLCMQRLTTFEPDDTQLEVAIAAVKHAVDQPE